MFYLFSFSDFRSYVAWGSYSIFIMCGYGGCFSFKSFPLGMCLGFFVVPLSAIAVATISNLFQKPNEIIGRAVCTFPVCIGR